MRPSEKETTEKKYGNNKIEPSPTARYERSEFMSKTGWNMDA